MVTTIAPPVYRNSQAELNQLWAQAADPGIEAVMAGLTASLNRNVRTTGSGNRPYSYGLDNFCMSADLKEEQVVVHELAPTEFSEGWDFSSYDHMLHWALAMHQDLEEGPEAGEAPVHAHGYYDESGNLVPVRKLRIHERQDFESMMNAWSGNPAPGSCGKTYQIEVVACDGKTLISDLKPQELWQ